MIEREREKKKCERGCHNTEKYGKKGHKRGGAITCERSRNERRWKETGGRGNIEGGGV